MLSAAEDARDVDLRGRGLTRIPAEILANRGVRHLRLGILAVDAGPRGPDLATNELTCLPPELATLVELRTLDLGGNPIRDMAATLELLSHLPHLESLDLQMTGMQSVPREIAQLRGLQSLSLGSNALGALGDDICGLGALRDLSAECCELRALPHGIGALRALQKLYLFSNQLAELPDSMGELAALRALNVERNRLSRLPTQLDRVALRRLMLSQNDFSEEERARIRGVFGKRARFG